MDNKLIKNIIAIIIIGIVGYVGIFVVLPVVFKVAVYILAFIGVALVVVGIGKCMNEPSQGSTTTNKSSVNTSNTTNNIKPENSSNTYKKEEDLWQGSKQQQKWSLDEINMLSDPNIDDNPYLIANFYNSSYICPSCKRGLDKTVFAVGKEYGIQTNAGNVGLKRVFTCRRCLSFFGPVPGYKLNIGKVFTIKYQDINSYNEALKDMSLKGTTDGRIDL